MKRLREIPPVAPGFEPKAAWPPGAYRALAEAARSGEAVCLLGGPGAAFEAAAWEIRRLGPRSAGPFLKADLSFFPAKERPHPGELEPPENGTLLLLHAELAPPLRIEHPPPGLIVSYEGTGPPEAPWRKVEVPGVGAYPRLSSCVRTAWREWAGGPLPRPLAIRLSSHPWKGGEAELLRLLQSTSIRGIASLKEFLLLSGSSLAGKTPWKNQKRHLERSMVERALQEAGGNRTRAAKALGVHRNTLLWHLRRLKSRLDAQPRLK